MSANLPLKGRLKPKVSRKRVVANSIGMLWWEWRVGWAKGESAELGLGLAAKE